MKQGKAWAPTAVAHFTTTTTITTTTPPLEDMRADKPVQ
jgi:hypothetical protein